MHKIDMRSVTLAAAQVFLLFSVFFFGIGLSICFRYQSKHVIMCSWILMRLIYSISLHSIWSFRHNKILVLFVSIMLIILLLLSIFVHNVVDIFFPRMIFCHFSVWLGVCFIDFGLCSFFMLRISKNRTMLFSLYI